jgi:hypothetical protein
MFTKNRLVGILAGSTLAAAGTTAWAGGSATWSGGDSQAVRIDWRDADTVRMDTGQGDYMLVRDGDAYMVSNRGGRTMVLAWAAMRSMIGAGAGPEAQGPIGDDTLVSMEATGHSQTVAGIEGEVYRITYREDGEEKTQEAVLSDHPLAVEMTQAWFATMQAIAGSVAGADSIDSQLDERGLGMLSGGDDFRVTEISGDARPAGDFELPAEPQSFPGMGR